MVSIELKRIINGILITIEVLNQFNRVNRRGQDVMKTLGVIIGKLITIRNRRLWITFVSIPFECSLFNLKNGGLISLVIKAQSSLETVFLCKHIVMMFCMACIWNKNSLPARLAGSPVQVSSWPKMA